MSHTWASSSSSSRVQGQRSSDRRRRIRHTEESDHLHARLGGARPAVASAGTRQSSEDPYGHERPYEDERTVATEHAQPPSGSERTLQCHGGYYVQQPKPSHNQKLVSMAEKEKSDYEQLKLQKRARQCQQCTPQALGGARLSKEDHQKMMEKKERELQQNARFASIRQKQKREEHAEAKRRREEKELEDKKRVQREKAVRLEQKQEHEEQQRREEVRRKRLERFT